MYLKFIIPLILLLIIIIICIIYSNKGVNKTPPTVTFKIVNNSNSHRLRCRLSDTTSNGWSLFKLKFPDKIICAKQSFCKNEETVTISKNGSVYIYNPDWKHKYGGGLKIIGKNITEGSTINVNASIDLISLSGGKVYLK